MIPMQDIALTIPVHQPKGLLSISMQTEKVKSGQFISSSCDEQHIEEGNKLQYI